jgi:hypothetical protein
MNTTAKMNTTAHDQNGTDANGNYINNRTEKLTDGLDFEKQLADYYTNCLNKLQTGLSTLRVIKTKNYDEAKLEYNAYMNKRIKIQLKLNKEKPANEVRILMMPRLYTMKTKMTSEDQKHFVGLCDDTPLGKWLDKKGWMFLTTVLYTPTSDVVMLNATLIPKNV